jgi:hypothetical protein
MGLLFGAMKAFPVTINHTGTTVTIVADPYDALVSAAHNAAGLIDLVWRGEVQSGLQPIFGGITCEGAGLIASVINEAGSSCTINTKTSSTGTNTTVGGNIHFVVFNSDR